MRILHLVVSFENGGLENLVGSLCVEAIREGNHHATLSVINDVIDERFVGLLREQGVTVSLHRRRCGNIMDTFSCIAGLDRDIRLNGYDILHVHQGFPAILASAVSFGRSIPIVYTLHAIKPPLRKPAERFCAAVAARNVSRFVAISTAVQASYPEYVCNGAMEIVTNGIDLGKYRIGVTSSDIPRIVCVAGLRHQIKGQDVLLKALGILRTRDVGFTCRLVGEGASRPILENLIRDLRLQDCVELLGVRFDVPDLLAESDLFILPSRSEGFGLALVEAMASGVPVVASDIDGPREIISHGRNGYLFEAGNEYDLADKVVALLNDNTLREKLVEQGLHDVRKYSIEKTYRNYLHIYEELACNRVSRVSGHA